MLKNKNKRGWVKMLEVFVSIMLLMGALTLVLNQNIFTGKITQETNNRMDYMIRTIQLDETFRGEILDASLPVEWVDFNSSGLTNTQLEIYSRTIPNLICEAQICALNDDCLNTNAPNDKNVYSRSGYISADLDTYSPRQLKIFCWKK